MKSDGIMAFFGFFMTAVIIILFFVVKGHFENKVESVDSSVSEVTEALKSSDEIVFKGRMTDITSTINSRIYIDDNCIGNVLDPSDIKVVSDEEELFHMTNNYETDVTTYYSPDNEILGYAKGEYVEATDDTEIYVYKFYDDEMNEKPYSFYNNQIVDSSNEVLVQLKSKSNFWPIPFVEGRYTITVTTKSSETKVDYLDKLFLYRCRINRMNNANNIDR